MNRSMHVTNDISWLLCLLLWFLLLPSSLPADDSSSKQDGPSLQNLERNVKRGNYESARDKLGELVSSANNPKKGRALHLLITVQKTTGRYKQAVQKARSYLNERDEFSRGNTSGKSNIRRTIKTDLAELQLLRGHFSAAINLAEKLLEQDETNHRARFIRLRARRKTGAYDKLKEDFQFVRNNIQQDPEEPLEAFHLARIRWMDASWNGNADLAQKVINRLAELNKELEQHPEFLTFWADCYREKRHDQDARKTYNDVFSFNKSYPPALTGMAKIILRNKTSLRVGNNAATKYLKKALNINPAYVPAYVTLGRQQIIERKYDEAKQTIQNGLEKNNQSPHLRALQAVYHYIRDKKKNYESARQQTLEINPKFGTLYALLGRVLNQNHKYKVAQKMFEKALELNPQLWTVKRDLGINETRLGNETKGKQLLEETFEKNPFDVQAYNFLTLLDKLETKFVTYRIPGYIIRLHESEAAFAKPYVSNLLKRIRSEMRKRYEFKLNEPTLVEIFEDHRDFSVRTFGIQGLGAAGACFGTVCTALSPRAKDQLGDYNWGSILWHEMAHAYALQLSNMNVPRWFTEGLSTYEESKGYSSWAREKHVKLFRAWKNDSLPTLSELDRGKGGGVLTYYLYGSVIIEFIIDRHGFDGVLEILRSYGKDQSTEKAFNNVFGKNLSAVQKELEQYLTNRFSSYALRTPLRALLEKLKKEYDITSKKEQIKKLRDPDLPDKAKKKLRKKLQKGILKQVKTKMEQEQDTSAEALIAMSRLYASRGQRSTAGTFARKAMSRQPEHPMSYAVLGDLEYRDRSWSSAAHFYDKAFKRGGTDIKTLLRFGRSLEKTDEPDRAIEIYEKARSVFPQYVNDNLNPYLRLYNLYISREQPRNALQRLAGYTKRDHKDFTHHIKLASLYYELERWNELAGLLERLLYVNYRDLKMHTYLAKAYEEQSEWKKAYRERSVIVELLNISDGDRRNKKDLLKLNLFKMAKFSKKLGKTKRAEKEAQRALEHDPVNKNIINFLRSLDTE